MSGRRRAYSPRINTRKKDKSGLVKAKELELRDARMLERLIAEIKDLSPWGRGQLQEMMNGLGPQQPALIPHGSAAVPVAAAGVPPGAADGEPRG